MPMWQINGRINHLQPQNHPRKTAFQTEFLIPLSCILLKGCQTRSLHRGRKVKKKILKLKEVFNGIHSQACPCVPLAAKGETALKILRNFLASVATTKRVQPQVCEPDSVLVANFCGQDTGTCRESCTFKQGGANSSFVTGTSNPIF